MKKVKVRKGTVKFNGLIFYPDSIIELPDDEASRLIRLEVADEVKDADSVQPEEASPAESDTEQKAENKPKRRQGSKK